MDEGPDVKSEKPYLIISELKERKKEKVQKDIGQEANFATT